MYQHHFDVFFHVFYTQRLGSPVPSCWVASYPARRVEPYPFAGYDRTSSLGTTLPIRWVQKRPRTIARTTQTRQPCTRGSG